MEIINIEDLEVGDEILISCQAYFKYLKVLVKPALGTRTHWNTGKPLYKSVKVSTRRDSVSRSYVRNGQTYTYNEHKWVVTPDDHNFIQHIDLAYRQLLLIKKN